MVTGMETEGWTVEDPTEDAPLVLEDGVRVASDDDAAPEDGRVTASEEDAILDGVSLGVDDAVVLKDRSVELVGEDDDSTVLLKVGTTTIPVGATEDSTEESSEVSRENVGKDCEEIGAELTTLLEDAASDELSVSVGGTGITIVRELEASTLEVRLGAGAGSVGATETEELAGEAAGAEPEYWGGGTGITTVAEDDGTDLVRLLDPDAEEVSVGYTAELGMSGIDRLDVTEDAGTELGGSGMTTV
ncbi:uncharacterized protein M421DRAFT_4329 [Didymella exigua CBS 183.55]|uniref:Uncharacterized protein n=1 Tax=Didymella exigua CBS 183.55 TaxID=1150837 RepID=A0A6A5RNZ5_9PLEO|nr:uncharacterized protein M421DRAFT_4329 [Didymella exigua CBS 183.55]KAF1929153.1 hypothetical protein M421DRAFT_4329 [Didymella exigua CBS 183.55]